MERKSRKLLTLVEAESMTGRKVGTLRKDIRLRHLPSVRLGRQVRVPIEAVENLIERGWRDSISTIQG